MIMISKQRPTSKEFMARILSLRHEVKSKIISRQYKVGELLPTEDELAEQANLSRGSVRKVMSELEEDGLIQRKRGHGTVVTERAPFLASSSGAGINLGLSFPVLDRNVGRVEKLKEYLLEHGGLLTVYNINKDRQDTLKERKFLESLENNSVVGAAIFASPLPPLNTELYQRLRKKGIKIALLSPHQYDISEEVCFLPDSRYAGYLAGKQLAGQGFKQILFIMKSLKPYNPVFMSWAEEGLRRAALEFNMKLSVEYLDKDKIKYPPENCDDLLRKLKELPDDTGFVTRTYRESAIIYSLLKDKLKRKEPEQRLISCAEPYEDEIGVLPLIPFIRFPEEELLRASIDYLLDEHIPAGMIFQRFFKPELVMVGRTGGQTAWTQNSNG